MPHREFQLIDNVLLFHGAHARPLPETFVAVLGTAGFAVRGDLVPGRKSVERRRGQGTALLQAFDHQHAGGEVDAIGAERQRPDSRHERAPCKG